nr:MAG TPA: Protein of unknown function (DUF1492) [Caudoviricetes sp.]
MTAKEYLRQLKTLDCLIKAKELEKERLDELTTKTSVNLSEKVQGGGSGGTENTIIKALELEKQIESDIKRLCDLRVRAIGLIDKLDNDKYRVVLSMYYVSNLTFEQIADNTGMTYQWIHKLHVRALKSFEKIMNS